MSALIALTRSLLAAGNATDAETDVDYLLSVDPNESSLSVQQWKNDSLVKEELVVDSVRPNSTAAYLITPSGKLVICITNESKLSAYSYDQDEGEWVESEDIPVSKYQVHPRGKVTATVGADDRAYVFFQDNSERLVILDDKWNSTFLPVSAVAGTPIAILATEDGLRVYYISASDTFIHAVVQQDGSWTDSVAIKFSFKEDVKGVLIGSGESFVLTGSNALLKVDVEGEKLQLGSVKDGKFVPATTEEASITTTWYKNGQMVKQRVERGYNHVRRRGVRDWP